MRDHFRTPAGVLGVSTLLAVTGFSIANIYIAVDSSNKADQTQCVARELAKPWVGLRESFKAPPGDPTARAKALEKIEAGIARLENLDRYC